MALLELTSRQLGIFDFARLVGMDSIGSSAVDTVMADLKPNLGSALVIGGMAVNYHGFKRYTDDVDILYALNDSTILKRLTKSFKVILKAKNGWHQLEHRKTKVRLELIPETELTTHGCIPGPVAFGSDNGFLPLFGVMWLKLVSGRSKDETDIIELAKIRMADVLATRVRLPVELHERFDEMIARANREIANNPSHR